jgi:preprotein translocase subunit Sec61beta
MADKMTMPQSGSGLIRYFDEYKSKIEISPGMVIALALIVIVIEIILHTFGFAWFG